MIHGECERSHRQQVVSEIRQVCSRGRGASRLAWVQGGGCRGSGRARHRGHGPLPPAWPPFSFQQ